MREGETWLLKDKSALAVWVNPVWFGCLVFVLLLGFFLRFNSLATNPGWYSDEGSDMDIARHLAEGRMQYFALSGTPLVAGRVPLFQLMLAGAFRIWGYDIYAARLVVAMFSFGAIVLLIVAAREMAGKWLALLAGLLLAILPNAVLYSRIAFLYNVLAFFVLLCWYLLWKYYVTRRERWLFGAALATVACYFTSLTGLPLIFCVLCVALWVRRRVLGWVSILLLAPGAVYLAMLYWSLPNTLQQDIALALGRTNGSALEQVFNLISNYTLWFDWTFWMVLGVAGLFLLSSRPVRWLTLLFFFAVIFNVMRAFPGAGDLNMHRYLGVIPLVAFGAAQFLASATRYLRNLLLADLATPTIPKHFQWLQTALARTVIVTCAIAILLGAPLVWTIGWDVYLVLPPLSPRPTRLDFVSVTAPDDARAVTALVNSMTDQNSVVLASPTITWLIKARVGDFQQALAYEGSMTENYGPVLPRERFLYDVSFENAEFVIVDRIWRGWAAERMPSLKNYLRIIESWPRVKSQGEFDVYQNPMR